MVIFKAKKLEDGEFVEGMYTWCKVYNTHYIQEEFSKGQVKNSIDPSTLQISFDGESWNSIEEVANRVKFVDDNAITVIGVNNGDINMRFDK